MQDLVVVREYAQLTTDELEAETLDRAQISNAAFSWLCKLSESYRKAGAHLLQQNGRSWLKLDNYVGVLESPCGQVIEILPKHHEKSDSVRSSRKVLKKLIGSALNLPSRETELASLELYDAPLAEWVMHQFLLSLEQLLQKGLRFDYQRVEEEQRYLRGQLDISKQVKQPPNKHHIFQIRHDIFLADRPENRLLRAALGIVCQSAQNAENWRLARELLSIIHELPESRNIDKDFRQWQDGRLMAHYRPVKPWCELILHRHMPLAISGEYRGVSLLFPMERLFEQHVASVLSHSLVPEAKVKTQVASRYLCHHRGSPIFQLRPDLMVEDGGSTWVLDTKWKCIDEQDHQKKYGLSQADFYQMHAYGREYLSEDGGEMVLIYPKSNSFRHPLPAFEFSSGDVLQVWPFDLETDQLLFSDSTTLPVALQ